MSRLLGSIGLVVVLAVVVGACGGGQDSAETETTEVMETTEAASDPATSTPGTLSEPAAEAGIPSETSPLTEAVPESKYVTVYDEAAVYTLDDLPEQGSYLNLDFTGLSPDQLNKAIHRLRSEYCTCGCPNDKIDECLVNDPNCNVAVTLAQQIIREVAL